VYLLDWISKKLAPCLAEFYTRYLIRREGVRKYCDEYVSVCMFVCLSVREDICGATRAIFTYGRGSVLLRRRYDTLCTSGFVNDIMFLNNGAYNDINFATNDRFR